MNEPVESPKPRRLLKSTLLVLATIAVGVLAGNAFIRSARHSAYEERSTARLIRDVGKTYSIGDFFRGVFWRVLPDSLSDRFAEVAPVPPEVVRQLAAMELRRRAPQSPEAVPALIRALDDSNIGVREVALQAIGAHKKAAKAAAPAVMKLLDSPTNAVIRAESVRTLALIAPEDPQVRTRLLSYVRETPASVTGSTNVFGKGEASQRSLRGVVLRVLDRLDHPEDEIVPILLEELARADDEKAAELVASLARIGPVTPEVIPALVKRLRDLGRTSASTSSEDRVAATASASFRSVLLSALRRMARAENEVIPRLIELMDEADFPARPAFLQTLGMIGPIRGEVLPALMDSLRHPMPQVQYAAVSALSAIGTKAADAVPALGELLRQSVASDSNPSENSPTVRMIRRRDGQMDMDDGTTPAGRFGPRVVMVPWAEQMGLHVSRTLARVGVGSPEAAAVLAKVMGESQGQIRYESALALWQVDRSHSQVIPVLVESIEIPVPSFARRLAQQFPQMGVREMPVLLAGLEHIDAPIRTAAISALERMGAEAEPAHGILERIAGDNADPLQTLAARALERLDRPAAQKN
ncbi:MAG: hypothetical protein EXS31_05450 [Pedosphaera sp.]|nr:hypothetical protein [Pedosphaera sp.]